MPELFGHTRARIGPRHALITPHNHVNSVVPGITGATVAVLINPTMGARFAQMQATFQEGGRAVFAASDKQTFGYVQQGAAALTLERACLQRLGRDDLERIQSQAAPILLARHHRRRNQLQ